MKILIISEGFPPQIGGLEKVVYELALGLKKKDNEITVVTTTKEKKEHHEILEGIPVYYYPMNIQFGKKRFLTEMFYAGKKLRSLVKQINPDIVSIQYFGYCSLIFYFSNMGINIPYTISVHGSDIVSTGEKKSWVRKTFMRCMVSNAKAVISNSNYLGRKAQELLDMDISNKLHVIWNGINVENYLPVNLNKDTKNVIAMGRFVYKKGFDVLIRAFTIVRKQIPEARLILAGDGSERKLCEQLAMDNNVTFLGFVHNDNIQTVFEQGNVFVLPSRNEPFGVVVLEAMCYGLPTVITASGGVMEIIQDGKNGFIVPVEDENIMAERIVQLLTDTKLSIKFREQGFKRVREFDWEFTLTKYEGIFNKFHNQIGG